MKGRIACVTFIALSALLMQLRAQSNTYFFNVAVNDTIKICSIHNKFDYLLIQKNIFERKTDSVLVTKPDTAYWEYITVPDSQITVDYKYTPAYEFEGKVKYSYFDSHNRECKVSVESLTMDGIKNIVPDSVWGDIVIKAGVDKTLSFHAIFERSNVSQVSLRGTVGLGTDSAFDIQGISNNSPKLYDAYSVNRDSVYQQLKGRWHLLTKEVFPYNQTAYWTCPSELEPFIVIANDSCYLEISGAVVGASAFQMMDRPVSNILLMLPKFYDYSSQDYHGILVLNNDLIEIGESEGQSVSYRYFFYREGAQLVYNQLATHDSHVVRPFSYAHLKVKSTAASPLISYYLPKSASIHLSAFNTLGQRVAMLFEGQQSAGEHEVQMRKMNLSRGMYFIALEGAGPRIICPLRIWK